MRRSWMALVLCATAHLGCAGSSSGPDSVASRSAAATGDPCEFNFQCLDFNLCTKDECIDSKCAYGAANDGAGCSDGDPCTEDTICQGGACKGGTLDVCTDPDPNDCKTVQCRPGGTGCETVNRNSGSCSDGDACTAGETCSGGNCQGGAAFTCTDTNPDDCVLPTCDGLGGCPDVDVADTTACLDVDPCTKDTTCMTGVCGGGASNSCPDVAPDDCLVPTCDGAGGCTNVKRAVGAGCDDDVLCTAATVCDASGACVGGATNSCPDGNVDDCLVPACDGTGGCTDLMRATGESCRDADPCTVDTVCDAAGGCRGGIAVSCLDSDSGDCWVPTCNGVGGCTDVKKSTGSSCDDGDVCTAGATCNVAGVCSGGAKTICADTQPNDCVEPVCDGIGGCKDQKGAVGTACADGDPCTVDTRCDPAGACAGGVTTKCTDSMPDDCFLAACDGAGGCTVVHAGAGAACSDGSLCTTSDTCNAGGQCVGGVTLACNDFDPCTMDTCLPKTGCQNLPIACPVDGGTDDATASDAANVDSGEDGGVSDPDAMGVGDAALEDAPDGAGQDGNRSDGVPMGAIDATSPGGESDAASESDAATVEEEIHVLGGGCRCDVALPRRRAAGSSWLMVLLLASGGLAWRRRRMALVLLALGVGCFLGGRAEAESLGTGRLDLNLQRAGAGEDGYLAADGAATLVRGRLAAAFLVDYSRDPLVVQKGGRELPIVENRVVFHLAAALGAGDRLQLGFALPVVAAQSGTVTALDQGSLAGSALGDLSLDSKVRLVGRVAGGAGTALAVSFGLLLPTGREDGFASSGAWGVRPRLLVESRTRPYGLAAGVGLVLRSARSRFGDLEVQHEMELRTALRISLIRRLDAVAEMHLVAEALALEVSRMPLELLAGLRFVAAENTAVILGLGAGLTSGYGAPVMHVLLGLRYVADGFSTASDTVPAP